jgi:hypothetical protein
MQVEEFRYLTTPVYQPGSTLNSVAAELPFTGVSFSQQLNSVGTFQGHVLLSGINTNNLNVYNGTVPGQYILWVIYTDIYGQSKPVWSGVIWAREYDSASQTLAITAQEMMSLYDRRRISTTKDYSVNPLDPNGFDPAYIAYQLMIYAEGLGNGKTGLAYNAASTTYATKKKYEGYELKSVYQAIKDLAAQYFDFAIVPEVSVGSGQLFNRFVVGPNTSSPNPPAPNGGFLGRIYNANDINSIVFQFPGNLVAYRFPEDASGAANKLYGIGNYGANNDTLIVKAIDPTKIGAGGTWPLLEDTASYTDAGNQQLLTQLTLGQLNATSYPPTTIQVVIPTYIDPIFPQYQIGDEVRLDIKDDYFPTGISFGANNDPLRIVAINVQPGENGPSQVTLTLTRRLAAGQVQP